MDFTRLSSATTSASINSIEHSITYLQGKTAHLWGMKNKNYAQISSNSSVLSPTISQSKLHLLSLPPFLASSSWITPISKPIQSTGSLSEEYLAMRLIWRFMGDSRITSFMMCSTWLRKIKLSATLCRIWEVWAYWSSLMSMSLWERSTWQLAIIGVRSGSLSMQGWRRNEKVKQMALSLFQMKGAYLFVDVYTSKLLLI